LGDAFAELNDLPSAGDAYKKAGAAEKLRAIGAHSVADVIERRRTQRRPFDANRSAMADAFAAKGEYRKAIAAYREAGAYERLIAIGDLCAADPQVMHHAHAAYVAAGAGDRLRHLGRSFEQQGDYDAALRSFISAFDRDGAERIGDIMMETSDEQEVLYTALKAYRFAKSRSKLIALGRKFVALARADHALSAFRSAAQLEQ
jgi:tetratricopeptide (TPR) repeat protein